MSDVDVTIDGMHCTGCENRVRDRISRIEGVRSVEADHEAGHATVTFVAGKEDIQQLEAAVEELGFDFVAAQQG